MAIINAKDGGTQHVAGSIPLRSVAPEPTPAGRKRPRGGQNARGKAKRSNAKAKKNERRFFTF